MSDTPGIGHNREPYAVPAPERVADEMAERGADLVTRRDEIVGGIDRFLAKYPVIEDADTAGKAADFAGGKGAIASFLNKAEAQRKLEKQPWLDGSGAVDGWFKKLVEKIGPGQTAIRQRLTAYANKIEADKREAARKQAEEDARKAREAEAAAMASMKVDALAAAEEAAKVAEASAQIAEAKPAELSRVTGTLGTTASIHTRWGFDAAASDLMTLVKAVAEGKAPLAYLMFDTTRIGYAIRSEKVREIPGVVIREERSAY